LTTHILATALLLALAAALLLAVRVNLHANRKPAPAPTSTIATSAQSERVVVMPTAGGRLEVATVRARETFARSDPRLLLDRIDLGTTVSEVRVDATYRYHIEMKTHWPLRIAGKTCLVRAGAVRPTLPVAFDTATEERRTASGLARFNKAENLHELERSLTGLLADRAPLYRHQAREAGRAVVAGFVAEWLVREQRWKRDPEHRVVVLFADDPTTISAGRPPAAPDRNEVQPDPRGSRAILFEGTAGGPGAMSPSSRRTRPDNNKSLWRH